MATWQGRRTASSSPWFAYRAKLHQFATFRVFLVCRMAVIRRRRGRCWNGRRRWRWFGRMRLPIVRMLIMWLCSLLGYWPFIFVIWAPAIFGRLFAFWELHATFAKWRRRKSDLSLQSESPWAQTDHHHCCLNWGYWSPSWLPSSTMYPNSH